MLLQGTLGGGRERRCPAQQCTQQAAGCPSLQAHWEPGGSSHSFAPIALCLSPPLLLPGARCSVYCATSPELEGSKLAGQYYFDSNCAPIAPSECVACRGFLGSPQVWAALPKPSCSTGCCRACSEPSRAGSAPPLSHPPPLLSPLCICREAQDSKLAAWLWRWSATAVGLAPADDLPLSDGSGSTSGRVWMHTLTS